MKLFKQAPLYLQLQFRESFFVVHAAAGWSLWKISYFLLKNGEEEPNNTRKMQGIFSLSEWQP